MLINENNPVEPRGPVGDTALTSEMDKPQRHIIRQVCDGIRKGIHRPGEQLRLRDEYMREFAVSKVTVQRAFARLIADGFVTARASQGTFVATRPPNLFRVALAFCQSKADVLQDKYRMSVINAAAPYDHDARYTLVPYYGMDYDHAGGDRQRLLDDLAHGRLAAVVNTYDRIFWPDDPRLDRLEIPQVHWGRSRGAGYSSIWMSNTLRTSLEAVKRLGGRKLALILPSKALEMVDPLMTMAAELGLEIRPQWLHGVDKLRPEWADPLTYAVFSLPEALRPDSLYVVDDHFVESACLGLVKSEMANRVKAVLHANFPLTASSPIPAVRVGIDARDMVRATLRILEALWEADREGGPRPDLCMEVPVQVDAGGLSKG